MTVHTEAEGDLQITIKDDLPVRKFDGDCHGLSHCMKAVDFIVELPDRYLFIEFKDPQDPKAPTEAEDTYLERFSAGQLDKNLIYKFRDSFLYEWASGRANKPIDYLVLVALDVLPTPLLRHRRRDLERKLPVNGPGGQPWPRPIASSCAVFDIETWNRLLPEYPIERCSQSR